MSMLLPPTVSGCSLIRDVEITRVNLLLQLNGVATINGAAHGVASSKDLLDGALELLGAAFEAHLASNVDNGGLWQIAGMLDVLRLLLGLVGQFLGLERSELATESTGLLLAEITGSVLLALEGITSSLDTFFGKDGQNAGNSFTDGANFAKLHLGLG